MDSGVRAAGGRGGQSRFIFDVTGLHHAHIMLLQAKTIRAPIAGKASMAYGLEDMV